METQTATFIPANQPSLAVTGGLTQEIIIPQNRHELMKDEWSIGTRVRFNTCSPLLEMISTFSLCSLVVSGRFSISLANPRIALSGVRNSWLMLAKNMLLARLAASARSFASVACVRARCKASLIPEIIVQFAKKTAMPR